jgi:hypothetical protein
MRDDLKGQSLSFTEIAKLVGENWQSLSPDDKEPFETQAQQAKDSYNQALVEYKKTAEYRRYSHYLHEFKQKQANQSQGVFCSAPWRKRANPHGSRETVGSGSPRVQALTRRHSWKVRDSAKRPRLEPMRSLHGSTTSNMTSSSGRGSLAGGSGSGSDSQQGMEPPGATKQRGSIVSAAKSALLARTPSVSGQHSVDEAQMSPTLSTFDSGFVGSQRDGHRTHRLPPLSRIFSDGHKLAEMATSARGRRGDVIRRQAPGLRHEDSSNGGNSSSSSSVYVGVPEQSPHGDASLPIHALLSNESSSSPSPPSYGLPPPQLHVAHTHAPYASTHHPSGQGSNGNGT